MIIAHVVGPNLVYVTDLISPRGPIGRNPATVAVGDALPQGQHHRRNDRRRARHHGQAGGYRSGVGRELGFGVCKKNSAALIGRRGFVLIRRKSIGYGSSSVSQ